MLLLQGAFSKEWRREGALHTRRYPSHLAVPERQKQNEAGMTQAKRNKIEDLVKACWNAPANGSS